MSCPRGLEDVLLEEVSAFEMCLEEWGGLSGGHRGGEAESHLRSDPSQSVWACVGRRRDQLAD